MTDQNVYDLLEGLGESTKAEAWHLIQLAGKVGKLADGYIFEKMSGEHLASLQFSSVDYQKLAEIRQFLLTDLGFRGRGKEAAEEYALVTATMPELQIDTGEITSLIARSALEDRKTSVNRLVEVENQLTTIQSGRHPGAYEAYNALYLQYGLPGLEAVIAAGYDNPVNFYSFWNDECHRSVPNMAQKLNLD